MDIVNGVNRMDATSTVILKRLVAIGIVMADAPRAAAALAPLPRPDIKALIVPYPKTGHMDFIREFQDDEDALEEGENVADSEEEDHQQEEEDSCDDHELAA